VAIATPLQQVDFFISASQSLNLDVSQAKRRAFVAVDNAASYWVHFLDFPGALAWVPPTTFGWVAPLPFPRPPQLRVSSKDVPSGYTADLTNTTAVAVISVLSEFPPISLGVQQVIKSNVTATAYQPNLPYTTFARQTLAVGSYEVGIPAAYSQGGKGMVGLLHVFTGPGTVALSIKDLDANGDVVSFIVSSNAVVAGGSCRIRVYPGITVIASGAANSAISDVLSAGMRQQVDVVGGSAEFAAYASILS
jgi:hypothetical protein